MSKNEFSNKCYICKNKKGQTFARIFFNEIDGNFVHLCKDCWNKQLEKLNLK